MAGAQWTGIVTTIAIEMLKSGMVEAVICVQRSWPEFTGADNIIDASTLFNPFTFSPFWNVNYHMVLIITVTQTTDLLHGLY